ncbi:hypothetical protein [Streptomyces sp. NPDC057939]|uniref:hypothetical protein n=1 Tax=Streptomyces sp. NPDC057939 TaxID=3346284 RepID=UPI0036E6C03C
MIRLKARGLLILEWISGYITVHGWDSTIREIGVMAGLSSTSSLIPPVLGSPLAVVEASSPAERAGEMTKPATALLQAASSRTLMLGFVKRQITGDLKRFREYIEERGSETGSWRGEV